eukprot:TRINITY_DN2417_c0_g1_i1.p1 TRINITY_DN2417_c0_g1~~TRINITY_DN2417_c0_g1_i1.p1  ORF type:complete len:506 (+),score=106.55 TRINITY_DN2417_c0_g1_i1:57-1574(+)
MAQSLSRPSPPIAVALLFVAAPILVYILKLLRGQRRLPRDAKPVKSVASYLPFGLDLTYRLAGKYENPMEFWEENRLIYGNVFRVGLPGRDIVFLNDPDCIRHFLAKNFDNYIKGDVFRQIFQPFLGDGIFNSNGDIWRHHRTTARPHFDRMELSGMIPTFHKHANFLIGRFEKFADSRQSIDLQDMFFRYTLDSVGETLFGYNIDSLNRTSEFAKAFDYIQSEMSYRGPIHPFWKMPFYPKGHFDKYLKQLDDFVYEMIEKTERDPNLEGRTDLLACYMKDKSDLNTRRFLRDMLINMLLAGRDTTAVLLMWTFYEISRHPEVEQKLLDEIDRVLVQPARLKGYKDGDALPCPTSEQVVDLKYMKNVLNETLRLHPSVPLDGRAAVEDDVLPNGQFIPKGTVLNYSPYILHRTKEFWGPDADKFDPGRFEGERIRAVNSFAFLPFLAGPRICLGQNMAYTEAKIACAMLLHKFRFHTKPDFVAQNRVVIILQSRNGMPVTIERR